MPQFKLLIMDGNGAVKAESYTGECISYAYASAYQEGDAIAIETDAPGCFCVLQLDEAMLPALVYLSKPRTLYRVPVGEKACTISPKAFGGSMHLLTVAAPDPGTVEAHRNLALNPFDSHDNDGLLPHASANVETRGEASFAARNAIDGLYANYSHGHFPFGSWGINQNPNAEWRLELPKPADIDELRVTLRADFPHDNWWTQGTVEFSDGSSETLHFTKTGETQRFSITPRRVEWLVFKNLIKSAEESPFPALTQFEVWGTLVPSQA